MSTNLLFEVPGWNLVKATPQKESTTDNDKKRKTLSFVNKSINKKKQKLNNEIIQKEKINESKKEQNNKNKKQVTKQLDNNNDSKKFAQLIKEQKSKKRQVEQNKKPLKSKKSKLKSAENPFADADDYEQGTEEAMLKFTTKNSDKPKGTLEKMKKKLSEGKFRWINEQLYTITGSKALEMFQENPRLFYEYHDGFRSVVESWPVNPTDVILSYLKQKPKEIIVADLGCGEGKIGLEAPNKVLSFDLVAKHNKVIVCDIAKLPIPDSFFDIVIFCLSLMGTNYIKFLKEAYRILKPDGELKIAEVLSRFSDINAFIEVLAEIGFEPLKKDDTNKMFIIFDFIKKKPHKAKRLQLYDATDLLKPCIYKKR